MCNSVNMNSFFHRQGAPSVKPNGLGPPLLKSHLKHMLLLPPDFRRFCLLLTTAAYRMSAQSVHFVDLQINVLGTLGFAVQ